MKPPRPRPSLSAIPDNEENLVPWLAGRQLSYERSLERIELRQQSDSDAITALANGQRELAASMASFRSTLVQLSAIPSAAMVNIFGGAIEGHGATGTGAIVATLVTLAGFLLGPRLRAGKGGPNGVG